MRLGRAAVMIVSLTVVACGSDPAIPTDDPNTALTSCRAAFQRWVDGALAMNSPGIDLAEGAASQDLVERRVFTFCGLSEAESLNGELQLARPGGVTERLIEPDMRTFAGSECVDESPLLNGTRLCREVGK